MAGSGHKWFEEVARTAARSLNDHLRSDAEDIAVDAYERGWRKRHDPQFREQPRAWLHRTAQNLALNHNRLREHKPRPELEESMSCHDGGIAAADLHNDLVAAVRRLDRRDRLLFWTVWSDGRPVTEAAEMLNLTEAAARKALNRVYKKLRRRLTR
jgi:RNA polymerase sigma factor (sigma-70 family)